MNSKVSLAVAIFISLVPWLYFVSVYKSMPETVPIHFGLDGKPNGYGDKSILLISVSALTFIGLGIFLLLRNIKKIDPKKNVQYSQESFNKIALGLVIFMAALNVLIISSTVNKHFETGKLFMPLMGIFFAFLGNLMYSIKPNYFVGIRIPWTLENEDNWRKTHQVAGRIWFAGGLIIVLCSLLFSEHFPEALFLFIVAIMVLVPVIYSFTEFKKSQKLKQ